MDNGILLAKIIMSEKLAEINSDPQLTPGDPEWCGFLNCCPDEDWSDSEILALEYLIKNWSIDFFNQLAELNLGIEDGPNRFEIVFLRLEETL